MAWGVAATVLSGLLCLWLGLSALRMAGLASKIGRLIGAAVVACFGILVGTLLVVVHALHAFSGETLVARVITRSVGAGQVELRYAAAGGGGPVIEHIRLEGDQWAISGGLVKWHPWLTAMGLPSYHRPLRLSGQFSNVEQQRAHPPSVYALEPQGDWVWEALYRAAPYLPFIEAVYGSAAYAYAQPEVAQEVYVTPSGYLIKRAKERR